MRYSQLGRTGLQVSAFGMGCGNFGGVGSAPELFGLGESEEIAFGLLDRAVDLGINFLDTADAYGGGRSESFIGRWLATKDATFRDRILVSSKVGNPIGDDPNERGLSRRHILRQIDASLGRLGVDHLDMYLVHAPDPTTPIEETMGALDEVVRSGRVRYIGASNLAPWLVTRSLWVSDVHGLHRFGWVQDSFNLLDQEDRAEMLELCRDQGLGFTPFSPLSGGLLTGRYDLDADLPPGSRMTLRPEPYLRYWNEATFGRIRKLSERASEMGVSTAGLALAWLHHHPDVTAPIVGPRRPEHFEPVEQAMSIELDAAEWAEIGSWFTDIDESPGRSTEEVAPSTP